MIHYALVGSNDLPRARAFYDRLLAALDTRRILDLPNETIWGQGAAAPTFGVIAPYDGRPATVGNGSMVALAAGTRAQVDEIHARALALGAQDEGAPGVRGDDPAGFYGAYFRDLDGNKLCVCKFGPDDPLCEVRP